MYEEWTPEEVELLIRNHAPVSIIDVREPFEFAEGHIPGAKNISVNGIQNRLDEINKNQEHIIVCHSGSRSGVASAILSANGFKVKNMTGGMMNWHGPIEF
ncbi:MULTISPECIES: rhodanese-like domain-containing protein [Sporolactobacillus]|uniref:Rhodanese-like domain-containing protein n=1 Tax=Sporolactobacillus mangiferae TaxID=2940498 RepID=A0ABT0MB80_9BACL|nr:MULTISPECIES: rhodanese-like domain-containing protein [Sporolactobacillus]MCL1632105.1 rhodanese-like domain-containing protein [Sporolactobacillus mangiferae]GEB78558.1 rhodanese-like domain-containing protein [Sporolactobacillus inulinus]